MPTKPQKEELKQQALDQVMKEVYAITRDCEDDEFMHKTIRDLDEVISLHNANNKEEMKLRNELYNYMYDVLECMNFDNQRSRFNVLKRMVKNVKSNDGSFDHDPLNIAARRIDYFMKCIPIADRYKLVMEIKRKTINSNLYNYDYQLKQLSKEYAAFKQEQKYLQLQADLERYDEIRDKLQERPDNKTQIALYNELLPLVNKQPEWSRSRKFAEKKTIYNHLAKLYGAEGMRLEAYNATVMCEKFRKALSNTKQATNVLGYKYKGRD